MSLLDTLRGGVKLANKITKPLQATVTYQRQTGQTGYGPTLGPVVKLRAIVDYKTSQVRARDGVVKTTHAIVTLLDVAAVKVATSNIPVGNNDVFTLPDGFSGPSINVGGFLDAGDGSLIPTTVYL